MTTKKKIKKVEEIKEVAVVEQQTMPLTTQEDITSMIEQDAGRGTENIEVCDLAMPFLTILQALSPQIRGETKVEGAEEGMLYNTVTGELFDRVYIVPCAFTKVWNEWIPRNQGGGFVAQHETDELLSQCTRDEKGNDVLPNGHHFVATKNHFVLIIKDDGSIQRAVISMKNTQLKKSRKWLTKITSIRIPSSSGKMITPPMYAYAYELSTENETQKRGEGNVFKNFCIGEPIPVKRKEVYIEGRSFCADVMRGGVIAHPPEQDNVEENPVENNSF